MAVKKTSNYSAMLFSRSLKDLNNREFLYVSYVLTFCIALEPQKRERENYDLVVFFLQMAVAHYPLINYHITLDCILSILIHLIFFTNYVLFLVIVF